jgi:N-methylhydantoinase B
MSDSSFDAVSLGILWDRLISIGNEIEQTLARTSFSTIARESWDLASILFDARGRILTQGTYSMPTFTGTAPFTVQHMLARFPLESLREGDILFTNNSWFGTGHNFDVNVMRPAFRDGKLVGFAFSISHLPDIGGRGFSVQNASMYEEGLQIPVVKLVSQGKLNDELIELIRMNVRVSEQVIGDIMANVTATEIGCRKLLEFLEEYDLPDLQDLADAIIDHSRIAMRRAIAETPDGVYSSETRMEGEGHDAPITLRCRITVAGERLVVDYSGTDKPVPNALNVPVCYTRAFTAYALKVLLLPEIPNNAGSVEPIEVVTEPGTILDAQPPCATASRHLVGHNVPPAIYLAMAGALPHKVQASPAFTNILNIGGVNRDGQDFVTLFFTAGGLGGMQGLDGRSMTPAPSNMRVLPTEILESLTSMTVEYRRLRTDSGGAGEFRGGLGQVYRLRNTTDRPMTVAGLGRRYQFAAPGLHGGAAGALRVYRLNDEEVHPRGRYVLQPGDTIEVFDAGGGGYGDPAKRDPKAVAQDIRLGAVSAEAARHVYGVRPG